MDKDVLIAGGAVVGLAVLAGAITIYLAEAPDTAALHSTQPGTSISAPAPQP